MRQFIKETPFLLILKRILIAFIAIIFLVINAPERAQAQGALDLPRNFEGTASGNVINLRWSEISGEEKFQILHSTGTWSGRCDDFACPGFQWVTDLPANTTSYQYQASSYPVHSFQLCIQYLNRSFTCLSPISVPLNTEPRVPAPPPPSSVRAEAVDHRSIRLTWTSNSEGQGTIGIARNRLLFRSGLSPDMTSYTDTNLTASTTYTYSICAIINSQSRNCSDPVSTTTLEAPFPPSSPGSLRGTLSRDFEDIYLSWRDQADNEREYQVLRKEIQDTDFISLSNLDANSTNYIDRTFKKDSNATSVQYKVCAKNRFGQRCKEASVPIGFVAKCDSGQALLGLRGRAGDFIDQVNAVCGTSQGAIEEIRGAGDNNGGRTFENICRNGFAVTGLTGKSGDKIDSFQLECQRITENEPSGNRVLTSVVGGSGGNPFSPKRCRSGEFAVGIRGLMGTSLFSDVVDNLIPLCSSVTFTPISPSARWESPLAGGNGGRDFGNALSCRSDEVLVGISARKGSWFDAIASKCVQVNSQGQWIGNPRTTAFQGGNGGSGDFRTCPRNQAVVGVNGLAGSYINWMILQCRGLASQTSVSNSPISLLAPIGNPGGDSFGPFNCPNNLPATGLRGAAESFVDRIGLICGR